MKLSIIPSDGTVCEDKVCYTNLTWVGTPATVHALQWDDDASFEVDGVTYYGWVEYNDGSPNQDISVLPAWALNACAAWTAAANPPPPPAPTPEEIQAQNKAEAKSLLAATDWVELPSVTDPANNPHLVNEADFVAYRNQLRAIAVNPPTTPVTVWPTLPTEEWSS